MIGQLDWTAADETQQAAERIGQWLFASTTLAFIVVCAPVIWYGEPLADDFTNCLAPTDPAFSSFLARSWDRMGVMRLARFAEIGVTAGVCRTLPFGVALLVPFGLTLIVAVLSRSLLRDLGTPAPWAHIGGALWLLQPLGTEAALWPASLHVPLGLAFALGALRLVRRGSYAWGAAAAAASMVCIEQTLLALPFAAWLVVSPSRRRRAVRALTAACLLMVVAFAVWPGDSADPRLRVSVADRLAALVNDPMFYVGFPAVGLGVHSIPLAIFWALPLSVVALAAGGLAGVLAASKVPNGPGMSRHERARWMAAAAVLTALANAPVLLNVPHQGSPRIFAPTWLILVLIGAAIGSRVRWKRPTLAGAAAGVFAAGALLSLSLSASVRMAHADFARRFAQVIAARVPDGGHVAVCGVRRAVISPAPRGGFALHELAYEWTARRAVWFYTGERPTFQLAGELWDDRECPDPSEADLLLTFDELLELTKR